MTSKRNLSACVILVSLKLKQHNFYKYMLQHYKMISKCTVTTHRILVSTSWARLLPQFQFYHIPFTVEYKTTNNTWTAASVANDVQLKKIHTTKHTHTETVTNCTNNASILSVSLFSGQNGKSQVQELYIQVWTTKTCFVCSHKHSQAFPRVFRTAEMGECLKDQMHRFFICWSKLLHVCL